MPQLAILSTDEAWLPSEEDVSSSPRVSGRVDALGNDLGRQTPQGFLQFAIVEVDRWDQRAWHGGRRAVIEPHRSGTDLEDLAGGFSDEELARLARPAFSMIYGKKAV